MPSVALSYSWLVKCLCPSACWGSVVVKMFLAVCDISQRCARSTRTLCAAFLVYNWAMWRTLHNIMARVNWFCNLKLVYVFSFIVFSYTASCRTKAILHTLKQTVYYWAQKTLIMLVQDWEGCHSVLKMAVWRPEVSYFCISRLDLFFHVNRLRLLFPFLDIAAGMICRRLKSSPFKTQFAYFHHHLHVLETYQPPICSLLVNTLGSHIANFLRDVMEVSSSACPVLVCVLLGAAFPLSHAALPLSPQAQVMFLP